MDIEKYKLSLPTEETKEHKGKWLDEAGVEKYIRKAKRFEGLGIQDVGARRLLRLEFQDEYGLSELEATNILNGHNVKFYIDMYQRKKDGTWVEEKPKKKKDKNEEEIEVKRSPSELQDYIEQLMMIDDSEY